MTTAEDEPQSILGGFIRAQRQMANLSLRQLSAMTKVSNPYLSQVERGLHEPSLHVLKSIADALDVSVETLFEQAGLIRHAEQMGDDATECAIRADRRLTEIQRRVMLNVYRSYVGDSNGDSNTES
jgi:transcriptional regulator with XRE-family HTH domain